VIHLCATSANPFDSFILLARYSPYRTRPCPSCSAPQLPRSSAAVKTCHSKSSAFKVLPPSPRSPPSLYGLSLFPISPPPPHPPLPSLVSSPFSPIHNERSCASARHSHQRAAPPPRCISHVQLVRLVLWLGPCNQRLRHALLRTHLHHDAAALRVLYRRFLPPAADVRACNPFPQTCKYLHFFRSPRALTSSAASSFPPPTPAA
jgi:hypothetical protein